MSQRKLILSMQMTIDGYVAALDDSGDWMKADDDDWNDLFNDLETADTYLLGRKMYPLYSSHWQSVLKNPDSDKNELKFARMAEHVQHIVFTRSDFKPDWKNTRVSHDLKGEIESLKKQAGKNIIAWGGAEFASSLINLGLVDEIRFALNPTILGSGKALFDKVDQRSELKLTDVKKTQSGLIIARYTCK